MLTIKACTKSELARMYNIHPDTLMRWIKRDTELIEHLGELGYVPSQSLLTPAMVGVIHARLAGIGKE